jgi:transglutaminase-like putative cysteine protease
VTLRGWLIATQSETDPSATAALSAWIDEQGQVLQTTQLGLDLRRLPYEVAFENWRIASAKTAPNVGAQRDILETTAIGANAKIGSSLGELRVRLTGADLTGFDLSGHRQEMRGDTLIVRREEPSALKARYTLPGGGRRLLRSYTRPEPLVQSNDAEIASLASRIAGGARDPRLVAERMNTWVHDSLKKELTFGIPSALDVLRARRGDCNEHTQLYVALARAAGIPTRIAAGLAYIHGKFYYHAWPEVYLNSWVAVDPTFGQFPADAAHLRFTVGGLGRQAELLRLMGNLRIEKVGRPAPRPR